MESLEGWTRGPGFGQIAAMKHDAGPPLGAFKPFLGEKHPSPNDGLQQAACTAAGQGGGTGQRAEAEGAGQQAEGAGHGHRGRGGCFLEEEAAP